MNRGENSDSIPIDLILDIVSRLHAKTIARFRCVSKLWRSMLSCPYFTELFLTRSSARPRLLFAVEQHDNEWLFLSSPQPQNPYEKSSLAVAINALDMKFFKDISLRNCSYASGLIYFSNIWIPIEIKDIVGVICNPSTGQYAILPSPELSMYRKSTSFLGFDPIDKQFKILLLFINTYSFLVSNETVHHISTLETENMRWRNIQCPLSHEPSGEGICINGILYYKAANIDGSIMIVCFDVRSEKFKFIDAKCCGNQIWPLILINYKGKLGVTDLDYAHDGGFPVQLYIWVLEDVEKHEWSKYVYTLGDGNEVVKVHYLYVIGMAATGEIVLWTSDRRKPFYVFYFNPEKNTLQSVEYEGFGKDCYEVYAFIDHVEDLKFNITKTIYDGTSISPPEHSTSTSSREDHQVRTIAHLQQDSRTDES